MKTFKKSIALMLALVLTLAMTVTAFADPATYSVTVSNAEVGHTYEAYQILAGDLSGTTLSNVTWGSGVNATDLGSASDYAEKLAQMTDNSSELKAEATALSKVLTTAAGSVKVANEGAAVISGLAAGYYLVKDADDTLQGENTAYTEFILKVVADTTITTKTDVPTVIKKVQDTNDTEGTTTGWQDSADYDIKDDVPFQLTATLANNVASYNTYKVVFHDTLSAGMTYNNDFSVKIDGKDVTSSFTATYEGTDLTFSCSDVKALGATNSSVVVVNYTAKLNENAVLGKAGNPNEVYLEYSNNPNFEGEGEDSPTGETPKDKVIVFTYKVVVDKVNENNEPLTGAEFTLFKVIDGKEVAVAAATLNEAGTQFTFVGLDDGKYVLKETKTPAGYNTISDQTFEVKASHDVESEDPELTELSGDLVTGSISFTASVDEGSLSTTVINQAGSTLPSTGGAGRVAIYVIGAILVIGAGVVLVTKRRVR